MNPIFLRRVYLTALGGSFAMLLSGCEMPTASFNQGTATKTSDAVAAAPNTTATTASPSSPSTSPSPGSSTSGSATGAAVPHGSSLGDNVGVDIPTPSTGFQPPRPGLPGSGFAPNPPPTTSGTRAVVSLQLSAGVALAQTLPDGTGMLFSVDYRFLQRSNDQSLRYFWVIVPDRGDPITKEVRLEQNGTLNLVVPKMRPEIGPFQCRLDAQHPADSQRSKVSATVPMKQPG